MRGSKYVPSRMGNIYQEVLKLVRTSDKPVCFSGAPCQVAAMRALLKPEWRKRVLLVDFICHGVPSLTVFQAYLKGLFQGKPVVNYTFRDKALHWQTILAESASGELYHLQAKSESVFYWFLWSPPVSDGSVSQLRIRHVTADCRRDAGGLLGLPTGVA